MDTEKTLQELIDALEAIPFHKDSGKINVTGQTMSFFLALKPESLYDLRKRGVIPKTVERGLVPFLATMNSYIRAFRKTGRGSKMPSMDEPVEFESRSCPERDEDLTREDVKRLLEVEQLRKLRRENREADGLLIPAVEFRAGLEAVISILKPVLETLHLIAQRACPEISPAGLEAMQVEIARAVNNMVEEIEGLRVND